MFHPFQQHDARRRPAVFVDTGDVHRGRLVDFGGDRLVQPLFELGNGVRQAVVGREFMLAVFQTDIGEIERHGWLLNE
ncbi:hypothetical protein D3C72_2283800 [compost metagenome]